MIFQLSAHVEHIRGSCDEVHWNIHRVGSMAVPGYTSGNELMLDTFAKIGWKVIGCRASSEPVGETFQLISFFDRAVTSSYDTTPEFIRSGDFPSRFKSNLWLSISYSAAVVPFLAFFRAFSICCGSFKSFLIMATEADLLPIRIAAL